jgi:hypothetical protein
MSTYFEYYEKELYPIQDGVLKCVAECGTEFFLTGGTALNRGFFNRRYSDDLDFFMSAGDSFSDCVESILAGLEVNGFHIDDSSDSLRTVAFCTFYVRETDGGEKTLKLDFVNDVAAHFGGVLPTRLFPRTDSPRNILSNKITALFRFEAKDVADIHTICSNLGFSWPEIIDEARQKELGLEPPLAAEILAGIPREDFLSIRWIERPSWDSFRRDLDRIAEDIVRGDGNSLAPS